MTAPGQKMTRYRTANLSAHGVFIEANMVSRLTRGVTVELVFVLHYGSLIRIHRRRARVSHVSRRGAGLMLYRTGEPASPSGSSRVST